MQSLENLRAAANSLQQAKSAAKSDELFTLADKAWAEMYTAMRHAQLVKRFQFAAQNESTLAANLAGQPGRALVAEQARQRGLEMMQIAKNHQAASELCEAAGEKLAAEVRAKTPKEKKNGNMTRGDELPLEGSAR